LEEIVGKRTRAINNTLKKLEELPEEQAQMFLGNDE
jgi:hypothetical protein